MSGHIAAAWIMSHRVPTTVPRRRQRRHDPSDRAALPASVQPEGDDVSVGMMRIPSQRPSWGAHALRRYFLTGGRNG
jgi:hypothetical protein